jgi:hypothetical protein
LDRVGWEGRLSACSGVYLPLAYEVGLSYTPLIFKYGRILSAPPPLWIGRVLCFIFE